MIRRFKSHWLKSKIFSYCVAQHFQYFHLTRLTTAITSQDLNPCIAQRTAADTAAWYEDYSSLVLSPVSGWSSTACKSLQILLVGLKTAMKYTTVAVGRCVFSPSLLAFLCISDRHTMRAALGQEILVKEQQVPTGWWRQISGWAPTPNTAVKLGLPDLNVECVPLNNKIHSEILRILRLTSAALH